MELGSNKPNELIGDQILNLESIKESVNLDFVKSSEDSFWNKRSKNKFKKRDTYQSFRNKMNRKSHKGLCENKLEFKRAKRWYGYDDKYMDYNAYVYEKSGLEKNVPHRNKVYCPCCSKYKIVFKNKSKADNFIKFNSASILKENGYAPIRSYYCSLCGGWHVTSLEEDHLKQPGKVLCFAEKVVMELIDNKKCKKTKQQNEQQLTEYTSDEQIKELIKDIKSSFNNEMDKFFTAYRCKDLSTCKAIHARMTTLFMGFQLPYKEIDKIKNRIIDAQENINKLSSLLLQEEEEKKRLIWEIQQIFKKEYEDFKHAYALRKLGDCHSIYLKMAKIIYESGLNLPFMKALKTKLSYMGQCVENLIDLKTQSHTYKREFEANATSYLEAV